MISPLNIRINHQRMGFTPREHVVEGGHMVFFWAIDTDTPASGQTAFRVTVEDEAGVLLMDSGRVASAAQEYACESGGWPRGVLLTVRVTIANEAGEEGTDDECFYLGDIEWTAPWISATEEVGERAVYLRREFTVKKPLRRAVMYACGLGYHTLSINGAAADDARMDPAHTDYTVSCQYAVLPELQWMMEPGRNCLSVVLGGGWRRVTTRPGTNTVARPRFYGIPELTLMLRLTYEDGEVETIATDEQWRWSYGPITRCSVFNGETTDARLDMPGWDEPDYTGDMQPVAIADAPGGRLTPMLIPPIREKAFFAPIAISEPQPGRWIVDFGQNIAGVVRMNLPALPEGHEITVRHAEIQDEDGLLYTATLRSAEARDVFISDGEPAVWSPSFTYHGFRYAEVCGIRPTKNNIEAVQIYTDLDKNSSFRCGSAIINAIHKNLVMTERDNMHSILTDCPQRDERMGWMNDATVRFEETPFNFDTGAMFRKIVRDISGGQMADGAISCTSPYAWFGAYPADPVCSSFLVAAWQNYLHNGDLETIRENYRHFAAWEQCLLNHSDDYIVNYSYYGDWAGPAYACEPNDGARSIVTPGIFMSTGYSYYNCTLLERFAALLGDSEEAARYAELSARIRDALLRKWYDPMTAAVATGSQACQAFALWLGIIPEGDRARVARRMRDDLVARDYRFTTGNLCTRYLMDMLCECGYENEAYELITREEYPSFGFMLQQEATTIWERFELKKAAGMNSHNHPMYGAIGSWLYTGLLGIRPTGAGFSTVTIAPHLPDRLMSAQGSVDTVRGPLNVRWIKRYGAAHLYVDVPAGMTATICFAGGQHTVRGGSHHFQA